MAGILYSYAGFKWFIIKKFDLNPGPVLDT
jgi:hypothetical protein